MYRNRILIHFLFLIPCILLGQVNGCPEVKITGISENETIYIHCNSQDSCVKLVANYPETGTPTSYSIEQIDYTPEFPFSGLANPISVNIDDVWSDPKVILPFNFCFYNQEYSQAVVSSNGAISFDIGNINDNGFTDDADECPWEFNLGIPSPQFPSTAEPKKILNAIYGVYHDIDPSVGGQIGWQLFGEFPCRRLVVSYYQVPLFDCESINSTFQMVLYESTNIIEVYIENKATCPNWNNGNSVLGIQNATGTQGITPNGRNTGSWSTENEAWRITPSGPSNTQITWYDDVSGAVLATNQNEITVCPTTAHSYRAEVLYTLCDGSTILSSDTTTVEYTDTVFAAPPKEYIICDKDDIKDGITTIDLSIFDSELVTELNSINTYVITYHLSQQDAIDNVFPINPATSFINIDNPEIVFGRIEDLDLKCVLIKEIDITVSAGPANFDANVVSETFADVHQILATATGVDQYLFSLDDGEFQVSGFFDNVNVGLHTIIITDSNSCFKKVIELVIIDYPKFFTPNGDGINDYWNISHIEELVFANITIFDRYGKELIQFDQNSKGWDGLYKGTPLPSNDYWFKLLYSEKKPKGVQREFIAHFSIKR
ncbi:MAG: hypothetical protein COA88_08035 [Kordia sp.]|nr:MAG: hypothetical protein COA88_08035 [Kordia sp.]